jgi:hypothetical protein
MFPVQGRDVTLFLALENQTWIGSVHPLTMKIVVYSKSLRLKASPIHGGQGIFLNFLSPIRCGGALFWGGSIHRNEWIGWQTLDSRTIIPAV